MLTLLFHLGFAQKVSSCIKDCRVGRRRRQDLRMFSQHFQVAVKTGIYIPQPHTRRARAEADLCLAMQMWGLKTPGQAGEQRGALAAKLVTSRETLLAGARVPAR